LVPTLRLLDDDALHASSVVANNAMNRERGLAGVNSYERELGFSPLDFLLSTLAACGSAAWLDLCCGAGHALAEAAAALEQSEAVTLVGVDLADGFFAYPPSRGSLTFIGCPVDAWAPEAAFDLITCVHGLHYVGDKLGVLARAASWLTPRGRLVADLDTAEVVTADGPRAVARALRRAGFSYDSRRRRVSLAGRRDVTLPYRYLGADDRHGPGYTGQPSVASHYASEPTIQ
jgi:SAM-dependent methyltransferase